MKTICTLAILLISALGPAAAQQPVFDMHVHLREGAISSAEYEAQLADAGVDVTAYGAMWFGGPHQAREGEMERIRLGNDAIVALAAANPKVLPIATVHPYDGEAALVELQRVAGNGVKVLKLHSHTQGFDVADGRVLALVRRAGELGMVVLMDNASIVPGESENLFNLAVQAPDTNFVFAHIGGLNFRYWNILVLARTADGFGMDNVYFDLSGPLNLAAGSPIEEEFVWTLRNVGTDKLMLGSDYPQMSLAAALEALKRLGLDEAEKAAIRYGNAQRLFGLPAADRE